MNNNIQDLENKIIELMENCPPTSLLGIPGAIEISLHLLMYPFPVKMVDTSKERMIPENIITVYSTLLIALAIATRDTDVPPENLTAHADSYKVHFENKITPIKIIFQGDENLATRLVKGLLAASSNTRSQDKFVQNNLEIHSWEVDFQLTVMALSAHGNNDAEAEKVFMDFRESFMPIRRRRQDLFPH